MGSGAFPFGVWIKSYWWVFDYEIENLAEGAITSFKLCFGEQKANSQVEIYILEPDSTSWEKKIEDGCIVLRLKEGFAGTGGVPRGKKLRFRIKTIGDSKILYGEAAINRGNDHAYDEENASVPGPIASREPDFGGDNASVVAADASFAEVLGTRGLEYFGLVDEAERTFDPLLLLQTEASIGSNAELMEAPLKLLAGMDDARAEMVSSFLGIRTIGELVLLERHPLTLLGRIVNALAFQEMANVSLVPPLDGGRLHGHAAGTGVWTVTSRNPEAIIFQAWTTAVQSQEYLIFRISNDGPAAILVDTGPGEEGLPLQPGETRDVFPATHIKLSLPSNAGNERAQGRYEILCCGGRGMPVEAARQLAAADAAEVTALLPSLPKSPLGKLGAFDGVCDPKGLTYIGPVAAWQNRTVDLRGRWKAGSSHRYVGPTGDPDLRLRGAKKWCVLILSREVGTDRTLYVFPYAGNPLVCPGSVASGVDLYVLMNDDLYGDNANDLQDPMRVV